MKMCRIKLGQLNHRLPLLMIILAAFATLAILAGCRDKKPTPPTLPAVTVANPVTEPVANYLDFTGNTAAIRSVTLVARVEGYLEKIHFTDGQRVKKGDVLFTIQQDQYKAQLKQAEAQLQIQKVALHHAETELARYVHLVKQDASTQTMVDHWQAQMETAQAAILAAQAQVELARLNLRWFTIMNLPKALSTKNTKGTKGTNKTCFCSCFSCISWTLFFAYGSDS